MSNAKFTPGPWRIVQREEQDFVSKPKNVRVGPAICGVEKSTTTISIHANPDAGPCPDVEKLDAIGHANADLIAAAPEIYEALESILEIGKRDMSNPKYDAYFQSAHAALAKARGESIPNA